MLLSKNILISHRYFKLLLLECTRNYLIILTVKDCFSKETLVYCGLIFVSLEPSVCPAIIAVKTLNTGIILRN